MPVLPPKYNFIFTTVERLNLNLHQRCQILHSIWNLNEISIPDPMELPFAGHKIINDRELRIVMVGKTGAGKSATGNTILGQESFLSRLSAISLTVNCKKRKGEVDGQHVAVIDTPGLFDTRFDKEKTFEDISQCITYASPGPHVFLVIIKLGRYTEEEMKTVENIQEIFGQAADKYSMVLFTGGDCLDDDENAIHEFVMESPKLKQLVERCNGQYHVFNNKQKDPSQVTELLKKIRSLVERNGGSHYTTDMFQEAEMILEQEKERILKEKNVQINKEKLELERQIKGKYDKEIEDLKKQFQLEREREEEERDEEKRREEQKRKEKIRERKEMEEEMKRERQRMKEEIERERREKEEQKERERQKKNEELEWVRQHRERERVRQMMNEEPEWVKLEREKERVRQMDEELERMRREREEVEERVRQMNEELDWSRKQEREMQKMAEERERERKEREEMEREMQTMKEEREREKIEKEREEMEREMQMTEERERQRKEREEMEREMQMTEERERERKEEMERELQKMKEEREREWEERERERKEREEDEKRERDKRETEKERERKEMEEKIKQRCEEELKRKMNKMLASHEEQARKEAEDSNPIVGALVGAGKAVYEGIAWVGKSVSSWFW